MITIQSFSKQGLHDNLQYGKGFPGHKAHADQGCGWCAGTSGKDCSYATHTTVLYVKYITAVGNRGSIVIAPTATDADIQTACLNDATAMGLA